MIRSGIACCLDRWADVRPFVRFLVLTAAVAVIGFCVVKPGYRIFKGWRLEQNLSAARKALGAARMDEARDLSLTVLRAGDPGIEAFRILEKSTASLRNPRHGDVARALITHPEGTAEDRLNGFLGIARVVALGVVGQTWATLPEECQQDPRFATALWRAPDCRTPLQRGGGRVARCAGGNAQPGGGALFDTSPDRRRMTL
jgi:hypothetical protein